MCTPLYRHCYGIFVAERRQWSRTKGEGDAPFVCLYFAAACRGQICFLWFSTIWTGVRVFCRVPQQHTDSPTPSPPSPSTTTCATTPSVLHSIFMLASVSTILGDGPCALGSLRVDDISNACWFVSQPESLRRLLPSRSRNVCPRHSAVGHTRRRYSR